MDIEIPLEANKKEVFQLIRNFLTESGFHIEKSDETGPWGGFFVISENEADRFITHFFSDTPEASRQGNQKVSPKILIVEEDKRLSWQYHFRRSEVWKVIYGEAGVVTSDTDEESAVQKRKKGETVILKQGQRHRLVGTGFWAVIAEIWQHSDLQRPSDEDDIVRLADDFGR